MNTALSLHQVAAVAGRKRVLDGVELQVPARGLFGIVGPNGAGKSSLLKAPLGVLKIVAGEIHIDGRAAPAWSRREFARHVGYVPQHVHSHWDLTVEELLHLSTDAIPDALIASCELGPLLARRFGTLSGGEQARAAAARALAHAPQLVLADEPAAHLDIPHQHDLMALLHQQARARAIVVVLHDLHLAFTYCNSVAVMARGRVLEQGEPARTLTDALLCNAYGEPIERIESASRVFFSRKCNAASTARDARRFG